MHFFKRPAKLKVFLRTCYYSSASAHKKRPKGFSHEKCVANLIETLKGSRVQLTLLLDRAHKGNAPHFIEKMRGFELVEIDEGTEAGSFLRLLDYVESLPLDPETLLYFVEDDYWHRAGWVEVLREAFTLPNIDYVTLYDCSDKYTAPSYSSLTSRLYFTPSSHWRTTPSTTNTYAMKCQTLKQHMPVHRAYSEGVKITEDHKKFCALAAEHQATLISPIPGWSTHMEPELLSPCLDWSGDK